MATFKLIVAKGVKGDGIIWRGEWSAGTTYDYISAVSRGGASWISKKNQNVGHDPLTDDGTWWDCMVADSLAEGYRDEALTYRNQAENFAESAAISAENAATSASNAATSEANAAISETNAATSEANALESANNAAESESNAAASEANALESANNAYTSEIHALSSENKAEKWAEENEDIEVETGKYSAKHWATKAAENVHVHENKPILDATEEAFTTALKTKLDGIEENANKYIHPATHSLDMITETATLKIMTKDERDRLSTLGGIPI